MSSLRQITANQLNAEKSTGPVSEEGKAVVSKNATKHGLLSSQTILPGEEQQKLDELAQNLHATLQPKGELELLLVDRIMSLTWRLRRAGRIEAAILAIEQHEANLKRAGNEAGCYRKYSPSPFASRAEKPRILNRRRYDEALKKEAEMRSKMDGEEQILGRGFIKQAANLSTLHRYETTLERSLFKALHELQRVQAMRLGVNVTLPVAVDIQGDGKEL